MALSRRGLLAAGAAAVPLALAEVVAESAPALAAAFGITTTSSTYTISTGAGLSFTVSRANGDMTSLNYNGTELQSSGTRDSHVGSGLGSTATVTATRSGNYIIVACSVTNWRGSGTLHHYLVAVNGQNNIYMATYVDANGGGELRWIQYLDRSVVNTMVTAADTNGGTAIESTDVYLVGSQTRSKFYSNRQAKDLTVRGIVGSGIGVYMAYGNRESSAGGPFFRDIEQQGTSGGIELYNYLFSGHNQTESQRLDVLYGPYCLMVAGTTAPSAPDMSFMYGLGLQGAVASSGRGYVVGKAIGVDDLSDCVIGWANGTAQYWTTPSSSTGNFSSPMMKPGTYSQTLYQGELEVASRSVSVSAGTKTTGMNLTSGWSVPSALFRIGTWDGRPSGFRNASKVTSMHPSDARMSSWGPITVSVGSGAAASFPAYQWKDVNSPTTLVFTLTSDQVAARTVRIGITAAYAGGRPKLQVNDWSSGNPSASSQPGSRSLTIGTYRGNNALYTFAVPASAFVAGTNTMQIITISGSGGSGYLSPGFSYDCVELY